MEVILNQLGDEGASLRSIQHIGGVMTDSHPKESTLKKGFTLIELLVVISIIALISSVVFSSLTSARAKARDANRMATARALKTALTLYEDKNGSVVNFGSGNMMATSSGSTTIDTLVSSGYLSRQIASDIIYGTSTYYLGICNDGRYDIFTKVERPENAQTQSTLNAACGNTAASGSGYNYAYGLPSSGSGGGGIAASLCGSQCVSPTAPLPPVSVGMLLTVGGTHSCFTDDFGNAYCWGSDGSGELGNGSMSSYMTTPQPVASAKHFGAIAAGSQFTCALDLTGKPYCWGLDSFGQLGDGAAVSTSSPKAVSGSFTFTSITAGSDHACGLDNIGKAYCWGRNSYGQIGDGSTTTRLAPVAVNTALSFTSIAGGNGFTCALDTSGKIYCWGRNNYGQLGDGTQTSSPSKMVPIAANSALSFSTLSVGRDSACGISGQQGYCWGYNGAYGIDSTGGAPKSSPTAISTTTPLVAIAVGTDNACALGSGGAAMCWGFNTDGELGTNTGDPVFVPTPVWSNPNYSILKMGPGGHTCAVNSFEQAYCWGSDNVGQIGNGTLSFTPSNNIPQMVTMPW